MKTTTWWLVLLVAILAGIAQSQPTQSRAAPDTNDQKADVASASYEELVRQREDIDAQIKDAQFELKAVTSILNRLQRAKSALAAVEKPDPAAIDRANSFLKSHDPQRAKRELVVAATPLWNLFDKARPGYAAANNVDATSEASQIQAQWQQAISDLEQKTFEGPDAAALRSLSEGAEMSASDVSAIIAFCTPARFQEIKGKLDQTLDQFSSQASQKQQQVTANVQTLEKKSENIAAQMAKTKTEINQLAIKLGLPLFCLTVLLMLIVPIVVQSFSQNKDSEKQIQAIFASGILVEVITVLLLTMTVLILGLAGKIQGEVLGTLLGGISGYVLNRVRGKSSSDTGDEIQRAGKPTVP